MDKRIIWFALIILLAVGGLFFYRYSKKPKTDALIPNFTIDRTTIVVGDSIQYEDHTAGATSWYWDFGDGTTSKQQKGYTVYYESNQYNIKLTINGTKTDSSFFVTVNSKTDEVLPDRVIVSGPRIAYVGKPITFTDNTPGAQHTNWQNMVTYEKKLDSKTYTTTFTQKGNFTVIATNEKNKSSNGQGIITGRVIDEQTRQEPPTPNPPTPNPPKPNPPTPNPTKPDPPKPNPPTPPPPTPGTLKSLFVIIAKGEGRFSDEYKPIKDAIQNESVPVVIINKGARIEGKQLFGACSYLRMVKPKVLDVQADRDQNGYNGIKIIVEERN